MKGILVTPSVSIRNTCDSADQLHRALSGIGNTVIIANEFWSSCPIENGKCDLSYFSFVDFVRSLQLSPFLSRSKNDRAFLSNLPVECSYFRATETWPIRDRVMPWRHQPDNIVATCDMRRNYPLAVSFAIVIKISHGCGRGRIRACSDRVAIAPVAALTALSLRR